MSATDDEFSGLEDECAAQFADTVTYKSAGAGVFSNSSMSRATSFASDPPDVPAIRSPITTEEAGGGLVKARMFSITAAALGAITPKARDQVVDGTTTWYVHRAESRSNGFGWDVFCRDRP